MTPEAQGPRPVGWFTEPVHGVGSVELDSEDAESEEGLEQAFAKARRRAEQDLDDQVGEARWWKDEVTRLGPLTAFGCYGVLVVIGAVREVEEEDGEDVDTGDDG